MSAGFSGLDSGLPSLPIAAGDCWNRIGTAGDRSCPELETHIHCRNCPVFASAARTFFDRPAPQHYLAEWTHWLAGSPETVSLEAGASAALERPRPGQCSDLPARPGMDGISYAGYCRGDCTSSDPPNSSSLQCDLDRSGQPSGPVAALHFPSRSARVGVPAIIPKPIPFSWIKHRNRKNRGNRIERDHRLAPDRLTQSRAVGKLDLRGRGGSRRSSASPLPDAKRLLDAGKPRGQLQSGDPFLGRSKRQFP